MKVTYALISAATLLATTALAQSDVIIKQHAKEIRDQNNVRQGVTPPSTPAQPANPSAGTASPTPVQQSIAKVRADLTAIQPNVQVTAQQKQQLAKDLLATAQGENKPSSATIAALAEELSSALAQKPLSDKDRNRLLTDLAAVLNSANIQPTQMQAIFGDIQAIFQVNGIARKDAVKITDAVKAVAAETRH
jgi:hypothetical protein